MSKEPKLKWLKVTKHNGAVHLNPLTEHKKAFLERQNSLLLPEKKMKIETVEMTEEEARKVEPFDKNHIPPTHDEVQAFIKEIDEKDQKLADAEARIAELEKQLKKKKPADSAPQQ